MNIMFPINKLHAWLQLIRLPNLLTVPGDPLAGFLLARVAGAGPEMIYAIFPVLSALFLYMSGLIWNDVVDYREDSIQRKSRPLPSGQISLRSAVISGLLVSFLGIACAFPAGVN
ncbi:UbiA family prenyltransferase, partial [Verrucomicrobiota bacterium]